MKNKTIFNILNIFLSSFLIFFIFWFLIITFKFNQKNNIVIFVAGTVSDKFDEVIYKDIDKDKVNINFIEVLKDDKNFHSALTTQGLLIADILIIPTASISDYILDDIFITYSDSIIKLLEIKDSLNFFNYKDNKTGLYVFDNNYNPLDGYIDFINETIELTNDEEEKDESFILLLNSNSNNMGEYSNKNKTNHALTITKNIIGIL